MITKRGIAAAALLFLEGGLAVYGVLLHYDLTEMYGNIRSSALENWARSFGDDGVSGIALVLVLALAMPAFVAARGRAAKVFALAAPVVMVLAMLAVTPIALDQKREWVPGATGACTGSAVCDGDLVGGAAA